MWKKVHRKPAMQRKKECLLERAAANEQGSLKGIHVEPDSTTKTILWRLQQLPDFLVKARRILFDLFLGDGRLIGISASVCNSVDNLRQHLLWNAQARTLRIDKGVFPGKKLLDSRSLRCIAVETLAKCALETRWNAYITDTVVGVFNGIIAVDNGEDAAHLVGDVGERRLTVNHLV